MSGVKVTRIGSATQLAGGSTLDASYSGDDVDVVTGLPIDGLLDVTAPTPADGDGIVWRDAEDAWVNEHALTEGDVIALITPDIYACTSLTVIGGRGSIAAGAHTDLHAVGGTTVQVNESTGAVGFNVEAAFATVDAITDVYVHGYYTGNHADTEVSIYNYDTTTWDTLITFNVGESTMTLYHQSIADGAPYFDGSGNAKIRFYHPSNGNASHRLYLDYIAISHATGTTGGLALDDITDVNAPAPDNGDVLTWDSTPGEWIATPPPGASAGDTSGQLAGCFDGGGAAITAGAIAYGVVPYAGTITGWRILGTPSGAVAFDVAVHAAGALPTFPTDSVVAADPPTMTADTEVSSAHITSWITTLTAGDNFAIKVTSGDVTWASLTVNYSRP